MEDKRRIPFILLFLRNNTNINHFSKLQIEPIGWTFHGSHVPVIQERIEYLQSLLPHLNTLDLLGHRQLIEERITELRKQTEYWKKRDFLGD